MKVQLSADQLDDILISLQKQLSPLTRTKLKLFKTLRKIIMANTEIIIPLSEAELADKEEIRDQMVEKLAITRRELPAKCALQVEEHYKRLQEDLKQIIAEDDEETEVEEHVKDVLPADYTCLKEINEGVPNIICKFERAMSVVEEASKNEKEHEVSPEDVAIMYFFKS
ncbi:hypothetical protein THOM_1785 [Trachipleistophora hominis]|uniref:Uncharacterized protein n=1 Tax=Trachipleistophora hominis TaxID=72359 RepID=L7JUZ0_TRAHO|nr:hypothetical protein THOM_1785 [Trachipleistophora hominis]